MNRQPPGAGTFALTVAVALAVSFLLAGCGRAHFPRSSAAGVPTARTAPVPARALSPLEQRLEESPPRPEPRSEPTVAPTPEPTPTFDAPVASIAIPAIRVFDAPLVPMGVRNGYMDLPYSPRLVAWYNFTGKPGLGGNAVFSAHLDYINYGPAVFAGVHRLAPGDEVVVRLLDGTRLHYTVTKNDTVRLPELDMVQLLASTDEEIVTLITCSGAWDGHDYSHRVVVVARRTSVDPA